MRFVRPLTLVVVLSLGAAPAALAQTPPESRVSGTLTYNGIPDIPEALRTELQRYRNARSAGFQDWMEDGSMLISTRFGETAQLHRVAAPGADRTQITFFAEPVNSAATIPGTEADHHHHGTPGDDGATTKIRPHAAPSLPESSACRANPFPRTQRVRLHCGSPLS